MKKLSLLLLLSVFVFISCDNDDDSSKVITSFDGLTLTSGEFQSTSTIVDGLYYKDTFQDVNGYLTFDHYFNDWGHGYSFVGFTYMNKTDNTTENSTASISGKAKIGTTYISAFTSSYNPAAFKINNPSLYTIKGAWVTNSTYAYTGMTKGYAPAKTFTKGSWFKLTATGYDSSNKETGSAEIYLAQYTSDNDKPVSDWIWFNLSELEDAVKVQFDLTSSDTDTYMNTPSYFCMDGITLERKY